MRGPPLPPLLATAARRPRPAQMHYVCRVCRAIQISASPCTRASTATAAGDAFGGAMADARFEVLGAPSSLLSVTLSASQRLYTRRGTLVALAGSPDNARSTLSLLNPLARAPLGVPFLYQRISATSPVTALIATRSPTTTFSVLHLDGTTDWMVTQRNALLAWTGHTLSLSARLQRGLSVAHWGSTLVTGRGLVALSAPGQTYRLALAEGEEMAAHPASVVAYSLSSRHRPQPFRFPSGVGPRLQVPAAATAWLAETGPVRRLRATDAYRLASQALWRLRTAARRTIWGDRLFLRFRGPATLLLSSRGVRVAEALSREQVDEVADAPAGAVAEALEGRSGGKQGGGPGQPGGADEGGRKAAAAEATGAAAEAAADRQRAPIGLHVAAVGRDGKVTFEDAKELKEFVR